MLNSVTEYQHETKRLTAAAYQLVTKAWQKIDPSRIVPSWDRQLASLFPDLLALQLLAAGTAERYLTDCLAEQNETLPVAGVVVPQAWAGRTSDGRELASLIRHPAFSATQLVQHGRKPAIAIAQSGRQATRLVVTQIQDTSRQAATAAITGRIGASWTRITSPPSCDRCLLLHGKTFRWNQGFRRHPLCDCRHVPGTSRTLPDLTGQVNKPAGDVSMAGMTVAGLHAGGVTTAEQIIAAAPSRKAAITGLIATGWLTSPG